MIRPPTEQTCARATDIAPMHLYPGGTTESETLQRPYNSRAWVEMTRQFYIARRLRKNLRNCRRMAKNGALGVLLGFQRLNCRRARFAVEQTPTSRRPRTGA